MLTNSVLPLLGVRLYTALGADLTALYRFNLIDLGGAHFIHTRADMALSEGEKRWLSDKDFGLRRAVKAENNIYNRNDIVYDKRGFLCTYGKEKRKKEFKQ